MLIPGCKYPGGLVELFSSIIIIYKPNIENRSVANPSFSITVTLYQAVVSIRLLFQLIISQAELKIHQEQNSDNLRYKHPFIVYYKTKNAFIRELYNWALYPPTELCLKNKF